MKLSDALKLFDEVQSDNSVKECLITRQEIKNEMTLKCNHSFEYDALLKTSRWNTTSLRLSQMSILS